MIRHRERTVTHRRKITEARKVTDEYYYTKTWYPNRQVRPRCNLSGRPRPFKAPTSNSTCNKAIVSSCGDSKPEMISTINKFLEEDPSKISRTGASIPSLKAKNDLQFEKIKFISHCLSQAEEVMKKKKKYEEVQAKKRKYIFDSEENLDEEVGPLIKSALGKRIEVVDDQDYDNEFAKEVSGWMNSKNKRRRIKKPKKSTFNGYEPSPKDLNNRRPTKTQYVKKNKKSSTKTLRPGQKNGDQEGNLLTLVNLLSNGQLTVSADVSNCPSLTSEKTNSQEKTDTASSNQENECHSVDSKFSSETVSYMKEKGDLNLEQDFIQDIEQKVLDRLLISALGRQKDDDQENTCKNSEDTNKFPTNKASGAKVIEIEKKKSNGTPILHPLRRKQTSRKNSYVSSYSETKVAKKTKKNTKKVVHSKKGKNKSKSDNGIDDNIVDLDIYNFLTKAMQLGTDDDHGNKVYDLNVDSRNIGDHFINDSHAYDKKFDYNRYDHNVKSHNAYDRKFDDHCFYNSCLNENQELNNLLMSTLSPLVERISYPKFIYNRNEEGSASTATVIDVGAKEDEKGEKGPVPVADGRKVKSVWATEKQVVIDHARSSSEFLYRKIVTHSKTKCDESDSEVEYFFCNDESTDIKLTLKIVEALCDSVTMNEDECSDYWNAGSGEDNGYRNIEAKPELTKLRCEEEECQTSDKSAYKTIEDSRDAGEVTNHFILPRGQKAKLITSQNSTFLRIPSNLLTTTIFLVKIVIILKNAKILWISFVSLGISMFAYVFQFVTGVTCID